jgi:hypothetical protein
MRAAATFAHWVKSPNSITSRPLTLTLKACFYRTKALPLLKDGASIVLTASTTSVKGTPAFSVYGDQSGGT